MSRPGAVLIDARGLRCPLPVLRLSKALREYPDASDFELLADDPAAERDVPAFAAETGVDLRILAAGRWLIRR